MTAFALGFFFERRKERDQDRARVTNFLLDMATRRGLYAEPEAVTTSADDAERLEGAVQSLRKASREVRVLLHRPPPEATRALVEITTSCNEYLELIERTPDGARDLAPLHRLIAQLKVSAHALHLAVGPKTRDFEGPGALAYRNRRD